MIVAELTFYSTWLAHNHLFREANPSRPRKTKSQPGWVKSQPDGSNYNQVGSNYNQVGQITTRPVVI